RDLFAGLGIQKPFEPLTRADSKVMVALRAHVQVALELGPIELTGAARALDPQAFRHRAPTLLGVDAGRHQLVEPAHISSSSRAPCAPRRGRAMIAQVIAAASRSASRAVAAA